jgi:hypothetical protein
MDQEPFDEADVAWPAVLVYGGEPELLVIRDHDEWQLDPELHVQPYDGGDRLIDSAGREYRFDYVGTPGVGRATLLPTGARLEPAQFQEVAARHVEACGAPAEWLAAHLDGIPAAEQIRAAIGYVQRIDAAPAGEDDEGL